MDMLSVVRGTKEFPEISIRCRWKPLSPTTYLRKVAYISKRIADILKPLNIELTHFKHVLMYQPWPRLGV